MHVKLEGNNFSFFDHRSLRLALEACFIVQGINIQDITIKKLNLFSRQSNLIEANLRNIESDFMFGNIHTCVKYSSY